MAIATVYLMHGLALGEPWLPPGDTLLRSDIQLLADSGVLQVPITTWPLAWSNIDAAVDSVSIVDLDSVVAQALQRVRERLRVETRTGFAGREGWLAASSQPRVMRNFENTPREKGEIGARITWMGQRFAAKVEGRAVSSLSGQDSFRLDGSYVGMAVGNWMLSLGYPERWWGPGWDGSLILSTNARPAPQISINRNLSTPFESRWLSWIGQWSLTSFMSQLDDNRFIEDAMLFGLRVTATPVSGLEIGFSRSAQWCGTGRPCDTGTLANLLLGRDNRRGEYQPLTRSPVTSSAEWTYAGPRRSATSRTRFIFSGLARIPGRAGRRSVAGSGNWASNSGVRGPGGAGNIVPMSRSRTPCARRAESDSVGRNPTAPITIVCTRRATGIEDALSVMGSTVMGSHIPSVRPCWILVAIA